MRRSRRQPWGEGAEFACRTCDLMLSAGTLQGLPCSPRCPVFGRADANSGACAVTKTTTNPLDNLPVSRRQILVIGASLATLGLVSTWAYSLTQPKQDMTARAVRRRAPKLPDLVVGPEDAP